ncbi:MAG: prepilin-type N-terminal cleavage/methylation domain-containing protein [Candidatus Dadabacteria bacterium]|nr:prepilin-type N-terminal cleavage/methylation domain-containing protein [Candidatus Dadabacteria bacterium]NIS10014.1 prepilin-type N-terminal cleavage/methylation domain-containing protein [Candidatus Dadabacteria bacterium]NIV42020.1 prepilin-type N-terminal cleavage/methylation domain-containing protein [Candidatus Dadabacteria bacterium]NIX15230.1 prepilin-type N-terminal cleavage/methylation domain-containing protein [Candidatus Dadabacteria bacterium]NIY22986.1 prepilin-type N-terminal
MIKKNKQRGFTLVEVLTVVLILAVLLALAGGLSTEAGYRRAVDSVTTRVANNLQLTKLQAARNGVEFRTKFVQSGDELQLITERGDSNIDSTVWSINETSVLSVKVDSSVVISTIPSFFEFRPNGNADPSSDVIFLAASGTDVDRCGRVNVSSLGRIATIQGHWNGTSCSQVSDE